MCRLLVLSACCVLLSAACVAALTLTTSNIYARPVLDNQYGGAAGAAAGTFPPTPSAVAGAGKYGGFNGATTLRAQSSVLNQDVKKDLCTDASGNLYFIGSSPDSGYVGRLEALPDIQYRRSVFQQDYMAASVYKQAAYDQTLPFTASTTTTDSAGKFYPLAIACGRAGDIWILDGQAPVITASSAASDYVFPAQFELLTAGGSLQVVDGTSALLDADAATNTYAGMVWDEPRQQLLFPVACYACEASTGATRLQTGNLFSTIGRYVQPGVSSAINPAVFPGTVRNPNTRFFESQTLGYGRDDVLAAVTVPQPTAGDDPRLPLRSSLALDAARQIVYYGGVDTTVLPLTNTQPDATNVIYSLSIAAPAGQTLGAAVPTVVFRDLVTPTARYEAIALAPNGDLYFADRLAVASTTAGATLGTIPIYYITASELRTAQNCGVATLNQGACPTTSGPTGIRVNQLTYSIFQRTDETAKVMTGAVSMTFDPKGNLFVSDSNGIWAISNLFEPPTTTPVFSLPVVVLPFATKVAARA